MAVMKSKGTVLKMTIASVLTAIPQIVTLSKSGEKGETDDVRALDSAAGLPNASTGFVAPPKISGEMILDRANAVHVAMFALMRAPANNVLNLVYTDTGPVTEAWTSTALGIDEDFDGSKAVRAKFEWTLTGTATVS